MVKFHKFIGSLLSKKSLSKLDKDATALPASEPAKTSDIISIRNNDAASGNSSEILPSTPNENIGLVNSIVNNVQYNAHSSPHTAISNSRGINVFQVKNTRNVHIGDNFFVETANRQNQSAEVNWTKLKQSNTIMRMMHSSIEIDNEVLEIVARHLGYEWKSFARRLGYSKGQIDAFEEDNRTLSENLMFSANLQLHLRLESQRG
ncbi:protein immune deficiency isoform X2 [Anopheles darlingi]|uniref:protein immune deficiency isoform X2 n=1 Tax=Anopheles darlingi TaxID=43151 RepID=UPI0021004F73|nr:protein immune deficiency isoform X2 [Anopheles darlingi]